MLMYSTPAKSTLTHRPSWKSYWRRSAISLRSQVEYAIKAWIRAYGGSPVPDTYMHRHVIERLHASSSSRRGRD